jgi:hypothetical protein
MLEDRGKLNIFMEDVYSNKNFEDVLVDELLLESFDYTD